MPSHLSLEAAVAAGVSEEDRRGNEAADALAKAGAQQHAVEAAEAAQWKEAHDLAGRVQELQWAILAEAAHHEPKLRGVRVARKRRGAFGPQRRRGPAPDLSTGAHTLVPEGTRHRCTHCHRRMAITVLPRQWRCVPCRPLRRRNFLDIEVSSHEIWTTEQRVGCRRCGRDMRKQDRARLLRSECKGPKRGRGQEGASTRGGAPPSAGAPTRWLRCPTGESPVGPQRAASSGAPANPGEGREEAAPLVGGAPPGKRPRGVGSRSSDPSKPLQAGTSRRTRHEGR